jgi:DNA polymerase-3 subunit alpha
LSHAGFVKFDLLGLSALSVIARLEKRFTMKAPDPKPGDAVFQDIFGAGKLEGIFQFSGSSGIRQLTMRMKPNRFEDLAVINALYRPGALDAGSTEAYLEWRESPRTIHPVVDDIVEETYGAIVYQEQVMAIVARIMGGSLAEADEARRTIVKVTYNPDHKERMAKFLAEFKAACRKHGMTHAEAQSLESELLAHTRYSFNKAHAVAYSRIAWEMAWWKQHQPGWFYCESMNIDPGNVQTFMSAAALDGINIELPAVNDSSGSYVYSAPRNTIYVLLLQVKYLGHKGVMNIVNERETGGPFTSCEDFMKRIAKRAVNKRARQGLYALGAFEGLDGDCSVLGVDELDLSLSKYDLMLTYLGAVIPSKAMLDKIESERKRGFVAGIVVDVKNKRSAYGPYTVYRLSPSGVFWKRGDTDKLKKGDFVSAKVSKTGRADLVTKERL